ncbi:MAG: Alpha/beta hydrolase fold protein [Frankiales bacterium]|nr:Alpha/beta hydrolase fold protein [Frankiales bacterium]
MHTVRSGTPAPGTRPLVLVAGVGADTGTWSPVLAGLEAEREVVRLDLPGFGRTPLPPGPYTLSGVADALEAHLRAEDLQGADLVGSSMGARLALEMARRGLGHGVVALDPGGFWSRGQKRVFGATLTASVALVRAVRPALPTLLATPVGRTALLAQLSASPWALDRAYALREVQGLADAAGTSPAIRALATGPDQEGAAAGTLPGPVLAVWGAQDRVTLPSQASTLCERFPDAVVEVWRGCGHFPHWDQPARTVETVLRHTA